MFGENKLVTSSNFDTFFLYLLTLFHPTSLNITICLVKGNWPSPIGKRNLTSSTYHLRLAISAMMNSNQRVLMLRFNEQKQNFLY